MAVTEDFARLILEADTKGFTDAQKEIARVEASLETLKKQYASGAIGYNEYVAKGQKVQSHLDDLRAAYERATDAVKRYGSSQAAATAMASQASKPTINVGMAALEAARGLEDLQYGFSGIVNNIPGVVMAFGGGAGLTAAISLCGVGVNQLVKHWGDLQKVFGEDEFAKATSGLDAIKKRINEIESKPVKLAVDTIELNAARKQMKEFQDNLEAFEAFRSINGKHEKTAGEQAQELFEMVPGGTKGLTDRLAAIQAKELLATDPKLTSWQAEKAQAQAEADKHGLQIPRELYDKIENLKTAIENRKSEILGDPLNRKFGSAHQEVGRMFKGVVEGNDATARNQLVGLLKKAGEHRLAGEIAATTPEAMRQAEDEERTDRLQEEQDKTDKEIRGIRKDARKKREAAEAEKIRNAVDLYSKGGDFAKDSTEALAKIQQGAKNGGKVLVDGKPRDVSTGEKQYDLLREMIRQTVEARLKGQGLDLSGQDKLLDTSVNSLAGQTQNQLKTKQDKDKLNAERNEHARQEADKRHVHKFLEEEQNSIKDNSLQEIAENVYASIKSQGGYTDKYNRFTKITTEEGARKQVQAFLQQWMHRQNGFDKYGRPTRAGANLDQQRTEDIAMKVSFDAQKQYQQQFGQLTGQGYNAIQATQQLMLQSQMVIQALQNRLNQINRANNKLSNNFMQLLNSIQAPGQTNLDQRG